MMVSFLLIKLVLSIGEVVPSISLFSRSPGPPNPRALPFLSGPPRPFIPRKLLVSGSWRWRAARRWLEVTGV